MATVLGRNGSTSSMPDMSALISELEGMLDLTQPDDFTDVTLLVEDKKLHYCRGILASTSPVWKRMFVSDFKEKDAKEIPLPGKSFEDVQELLYCIYPAIQKPISENNVMRILPLADEYQMNKLKVDCENFLLYELSEADNQENIVRYLVLAQKFNLERLLELTVELTSQLPLDVLESNEDYSLIHQETLLKTVTSRAKKLELLSAKQEQVSNSWEKKCGEVEEVLKKMSREKLTVKRQLDEVEGAWEIKGSDARCIDPVHIYGPRNYSCEKCTRQVETYIQSKIWYLLNRGSTYSGITWPQ